MTRENQIKTATWIAATSSWRWTQQDTTYDSYGLATDVNNWSDVTNGTDDTCTHTDYARNATSWLIALPSQSVTTDCAGSPTDSHYLQGAQTLYDGSNTVGAAPSQGLPTQSNAMTNAVGTTLTWTKHGRSTYDQYGRPQDSFDALEHKTMTRYTPASGGPVTATTVTNPLGHVVANTVEPGHGTITSVLDANNQTTTAQYDPLGRRTKVWLPGRATNVTGNSEYVYTLSNSAPNVVTTKTLGPNGNQIVSTSLYDGRLRPRQTQSPAAQAKGGRIVADTAYDARSLEWQHTTFWDGTTAPGAALAGFTDSAVNQQTRTTFDSLQRSTVEGLYAANVLKWQTTTSYDGDSTTVVPPAGGVPTRQTFDAAGRVTALRQYTAGSIAGAYQNTTYQYDSLGQQTKFVDPAGNQWTTTYDRLGHVTASTDPDAGSSSAGYDAQGRKTSSTDGRGITLAYTYDDLDRKTGVYEGTTSGIQRIGWVYDTVRKGSQTSSTRYAGSVAYTTTVNSYDVQGRALSATTVLPAAAGALSGTYTVTATYNVDGSSATTTYPLAGGLPQETVTNTYDATGRPLTMTGLDTYIADTSYYGFGPIYQQVLGSGTKQVRNTATVEESTGRLTASLTETQNQTTTSNWDQQLGLAYAFDNAGSITSVKESNSGGVAANECFKHDGLQELTEAWTTTAAACQTNPSQVAVGGADPYWTSYQYQSTNGNRSSEVRHAATGDTIRTYVYSASGTSSVRPHAVTSISDTGAATGTDSFGYDNAGNTLTRAIAGGPNQTLTWDKEGRLGTIASGGTTTAYTYTADGSRLLAVNPQSATAYMPGGFEVRLQGGNTTATRYYGDVAVRSTSDGLSWLASDHHGTGSLAINATTFAAIRRRLDPFGNPRTTAAVNWPSTRGFVGGTKDDSGLTHLGAREYDPTTGRFMSDDSITNPQDPLQMNGYSYADNSPLRLSDPSGTEPRPWHDPNYDPNTCAHSKSYECHPADDPMNKNGPPAPPNCHNKGYQINCDLTGEEKTLKNKAEELVFEMQQNCRLLCLIGLGKTNNKKSLYEVAWCAANWDSCYYASHAAPDEATVAANAAYPGGEKSQDPDIRRKWNAFHHAYWFALLGGNTGLSRDDAVLLGVAHELGGLTDRINDGNATGNPNRDYGQRDSRADMYNNAAGFDIGRNMRNLPISMVAAPFEVMLSAEVKAAVESNRLATYGD